MGSSPRTVLRLALPAALKHLLDILQILIDMLMVGLISVSALAAVGMSMQFMMVLYAVMTLYVVGGNAVIARLIGERRRRRASALLFTLLLFATLFSIPFALGGYLSAEMLYAGMGAEAEVVEMGGIYFSILSLGITLIFLDGLFFNALSAAGDTTSSMYIKLLSALINALFNYLLIFGHGGFEAMGIAGAAYATLIAYGFNICVYSVLLIRGRGVLQLIPHITLHELRRALRVGWSAMLERLLSVTSFIFFVMIITVYGTSTLAGYQIGLRIEGLAFMPGFGFAVAAMALVGQNLGAKNPDAAYRSGLYSAKLAALFMGSVGLVLVAVPEYLAGFFTSDAEAIEEAAMYLMLVGISQVPLAMTFVLSGALRGAGATKTTMKINTASLWLLRVIPSFLAMSAGLGIGWIYIIMTIETFIKGALFWYIFKQRKWQKIRI